LSSKDNPLDSPAKSNFSGDQDSRPEVSSDQDLGTQLQFTESDKLGMDSSPEGYPGGSKQYQLDFGDLRLVPKSSQDLSNRVDTCDFNVDENECVDENLPDLPH
jgi:hypothetical protein